MQSSDLKNNIKGMLKLAVKALLVFALCFILKQVLFDVLWLDPDFPNAYDRSFEHALMLQAKALSAERDSEVIVFGASYVPFSIDNAEMESVLGQKTQILGVEASMGIPVLIDLLYDSARPGDTIVYMLGTANHSMEDTVAICAALESDKEMLMSYIQKRDGLKDSRSNLIWRKLYTLTLGKPVIWAESKLAKKKQVYSIDSFDENGNMIIDRPEPLPAMAGFTEAYESIEMDDVDLKTVDQLNEFSEWCKKNDITFVIAYAPFMDVIIINTEEQLNEFQDEVTSALHVDFINRLQDTIMPRDCFYNHPSHLTTPYAKVYSHDLAVALKNYCEEKQ